MKQWNWHLVIAVGNQTSPGIRSGVTCWQKGGRLFEQYNAFLTGAASADVVQLHG